MRQRSSTGLLALLGILALLVVPGERPVVATPDLLAGVSSAPGLHRPTGHPATGWSGGELPGASEGRTPGEGGDGPSPELHDPGPPSPTARVDRLTIPGRGHSGPSAAPRWGARLLGLLQTPANAPPGS